MGRRAWIGRRTVSSRSRSRRRWTSPLRLTSRWASRRRLCFAWRARLGGGALSDGVRFSSQADRPRAAVAEHARVRSRVTGLLADSRCLTLMATTPWVSSSTRRSASRWRFSPGCSPSSSSATSSASSPARAPTGDSSFDGIPLLAPRRRPGDRALAAPPQKNCATAPPCNHYPQSLTCHHARRRSSCWPGHRARRVWRGAARAREGDPLEPAGAVQDRRPARSGCHPPARVFRLPQQRDELAALQPDRAGSWLMARDVTKGRQHLNFSKWDEVGRRGTPDGHRKHLGAGRVRRDAQAVLRLSDAPVRAPSDADKAVLKSWVEAEKAKAKAKGEGEGEGEGKGKDKGKRQVAAATRRVPATSTNCRSRPEKASRLAQAGRQGADLRNADTARPRTANPAAL